MPIGFIGLGDQGGPMARRIVDAGMPTVLWARRPEALEPYRDTAAVFADSIEALAEQCEHVGVCVVDDAGAIEVCDKLIAAMPPGGRIAVHSTVLPQTCRDLAAKAAEQGLALLDAPVSGGSPLAKVGKLTVMVGGTSDAFEAARPVFETFAALIVHLGEVGAGQLAKIINNSLMAAHVALGHHALAAGDPFGMDRQALADLVTASSGRSFGFEVAARMPRPGAFAHGAKLLDKDVRLLGQILGDSPHYPPFRDVALPFSALVEADAKAS